MQLLAQGRDVRGGQGRQGQLALGGLRQVRVALRRRVGLVERRVVLLLGGAREGAGLLHY